MHWNVPVVTGFIGCENFGRFFPWPYSKGWSDMEQEFVERWSPILDKFAEYGVNLLTNLTPMSWSTTSKPLSGPLN